MVALNSDRYHDFFVESVPLGEPIIEYAQSQEWDQIRLTGLPKQALEALKGAFSSVEGSVSRTIGAGSASTPSESKSASEPVKRAPGPAVTFTHAAKEAPVKVESTSPATPNLPVVPEAGRPVGLKISEGLQDIVSKAESAIKGESSSSTSSTPSSSESEPESEKPTPASTDKNVYTTPLPLGFEPPPGYTRPAPPKPSKKPKSTSPTLPLVAPAVRELSASEPVIAQIASSIDGLATLLRDAPGTASSSSGAKDILDTAKVDLVALGTRIEAVKKEEQAKLEAQLEEQAKEYSTKMLELEIDLQDKIDAQEEGFKVILDEEKQRILQSYREKLAGELETQSEIINQRCVASS